MSKNRWEKLITGMLIVTGGFAFLNCVGKKKRDSKDIDNDNKYLNGTNVKLLQKAGWYEVKIKPMMDKVLSFLGLVFLSPLYGMISLAIFVDDPGPVLFTQKRVGKGGHFFLLHKFRSMKMNTPHDVPTHLLSDPEQYITRVGKVLRKTSLDELPQIWDIFVGNMSIIGPRPALWNQEDLVAEREKYGANDVKPGLTGWAQINGRDELEITEKARLDGEYAVCLHKGGWKAFQSDARCFCGTICSVLMSDGVVEGGTGNMNKENKCSEKNEIELRTLGNTGIKVTALGFGCASVWGKNMITDRQAQELFECAYTLGIRYFDTGHSYGNAEERIGKILKTSKIVKREDIIISTKFGTRIINGKLVHDVSPEWIRKSVNLSLQRMGIEYIDCLQIHGPRKEDFTDELYEVLDELKQQGIVKAVGANSFDTDLLNYICEEKKLDFVMLDYNIMRQEREELIQKLYNNGIGIIAGAALAESLYSNRVFKIRKMKDIWYLARAVKNFREQMLKGRKYRFINDVNGMTGSQIALKYVLNNSLISTAVFGTTTMSHLKENIAAVNIDIPEDIEKKIGLIR